MKRLILGVAAALVLSAGPAMADGMPTKGSVRAAPAAAAGPSWDGFYIGVGIGAGAAVTDVSASCCGYEFASLDGAGAEGIFGTVTVGYDRVIRPGWVAGVFADYDFGSNISTDVSFFGNSGSIDLDHTWSIGGRLGFLVNPSTLVYASAGYTQAEFDVSSAGSKTFDGYFVGAGIETFLRQNWTLKLDYRFSRFDEESFGFIKEDCFIDLEPTTHTARLVLSYKFGHPHN